MTPTLTPADREWIESTFQKMLNVSTRMAVKRTLEETGQIKKHTSLADVRHKYGSSVAKEARMSPKIQWIPKGKAGKRSGLYCKTTEFDNFMNFKEFDFLKR